MPENQRMGANFSIQRSNLKFWNNLLALRIQHSIKVFIHRHFMEMIKEWISRVRYPYFPVLTNFTRDYLPFFM